MGVTPQWFNKRRGLAMGLASGGSGIGGLVLPFILTPINNSLGIGWGYRILGFICLGCDVISCLIVKPKYPQRRKKNEKKFSLRDVFNFEVLKDSNYVLWVVASMIALSGFFVPYFFFPCKC